VYIQSPTILSKTEAWRLDFYILVLFKTRSKIVVTEL